MIGKALDSNNDLIVENGQFKTVSDAAQTLQHVRSKLLTYRGEYFLDNTIGVPYFEEIFVKPVNLANVESIFKTVILSDPEIAQLLEFNLDYEGGSERLLKISFRAKTIYDDIIDNEVTLNV